MKVYCKTHKKQDYYVVAVCDEDILGKPFGSQKISPYFYQGDLIEIPRALDLLRTALNFNIAGKFIIKACVDSGIITEKGIITMDNIPCAMKLCF